MNFIGMIMQEENSVELKYCERCGGLWLRRPGHDEVHCGRCRAQRAYETERVADRPVVGGS